MPVAENARRGRMDVQIDGHTDRTEFIGPLPALPEVQKINLIKDYAVWNSFPKRIVHSINKRELQTNNSKTSRSKKAYEDCVKIFFNLNYTGQTAERMVKSCIKELYKSFKQGINVNFLMHYKLQKCCSLQIQKIKDQV